MPDDAESAVVRHVAPNEVDTRPDAADSLLLQVRPHWQSKSLIQRVRRLLPVDPSSACQRLFNAAIHDLKTKLVQVGLDVCQEAAKAHRLPVPASEEDIYDNYSTSKVIDLAYRVGLLARPDWRRLKRVYSIRKDLEHEDDEYEADVADCVYIFKACVELVLAKDFVDMLRVDDVVELIQSDDAVQPSADMVEDLEHAPDVRQEQIARMLISKALDSTQADIVQQNAIEALRSFKLLLRDSVRARLPDAFGSTTSRSPYSLREMKVAHASGIAHYLRMTKRQQFFSDFQDKLDRIGHAWQSYDQHIVPLDDFEDVGGFAACPAANTERLLYWMVRCYLGSPGGTTSWGNVRHVFYSNTAAPKIEAVMKELPSTFREIFDRVVSRNDVISICKNKHIQRRLDDLIDIVEGGQRAKLDS